MLELRCVYLTQEWNTYVAFRVERQTERLYPYLDSLPTIPWTAAEPDPPDADRQQVDLVCESCGSDRMVLQSESSKPSWRELLGYGSSASPPWYADLRDESDRIFWDGLMGEGFNAWYLETPHRKCKGSGSPTATTHPTAPPRFCTACPLSAKLLLSRLAPRRGAAKLLRTIYACTSCASIDRNSFPAKAKVDNLLVGDPGRQAASFTPRSRSPRADRAQARLTSSPTSAARWCQTHISVTSIWCLTRTAGFSWPVAMHVASSRSCMCLARRKRHRAIDKRV